MKYRIEAIDDSGQPLEGVTVDGVAIVPPGGRLLITLPANTLDNDLARVREEIQEFFGASRLVGVIRAGDVGVIYFAEREGTQAGHNNTCVSSEGSSWAMDQLTQDYTTMRALGSY